MRTLDTSVKTAGKAGNFVYGVLEAITRGRAAVLITGSSQRLTGLEILSDNLHIGDRVIVDYSSGVPPFVRGHGTETIYKQKEIIIGLESILQDVADEVSTSVIGDNPQTITKGVSLLQFNRIVFDESNMFSAPFSFIIPMVGVYWVSCQILVEGINCPYDHRNRIWMQLSGSTCGIFATSMAHQFEHAESFTIQAEISGVITGDKGEIVTCSAWLDSAFGQNYADISYEGYGPYATLSPAFQIFKMGGGFFLENVDGLFWTEYPGYYDPSKIELSNNEGFMYVGDVYDYARAIANSRSESNQNLVADFQFQEVEEGESYFSLFLKTSTDWMNWNTPTTGYELQISSRGGWTVWRMDNGVQTLLESYNSNPTTMWQRFEFEVDGANVRAKVWVKNESEPGWQVDYADGSPIAGAGRMQLGHFNITGSRWLRIDNLDLTTP
jgi:hypothetical protein